MKEQYTGVLFATTTFSRKLVVVFRTAFNLLSLKAEQRAIGKRKNLETTNWVIQDGTMKSGDVGVAKTAFSACARIAVTGDIF